jgi:hypothetical protein
MVQTGLCLEQGLRTLTEHPRLPAANHQAEALEGTPDLILEVTSALH